MTKPRINRMATTVLPMADKPWCTAIHKTRAVIASTPIIVIKRLKVLSPGPIKTWFCVTEGDPINRSSQLATLSLSTWYCINRGHVLQQYQKVMTLLPELFVQTDYSYGRTSIS